MSAPIPKLGALLVVMSTACGDPRPALTQVDLSTGAIDFWGVYEIQFVQHGAIRTARAVVRTSFRRP